MWSEGYVNIGNNTFTYYAKHYEEPSEDYGIDGGRISKLMLQRAGETVYNYDRGLDLAPIDNVTKEALEEVLKQLN